MGYSQASQRVGQDWATNTFNYLIQFDNPLQIWWLKTVICFFCTNLQFEQAPATTGYCYSMQHKLMSAEWGWNSLFSLTFWQHLAVRSWLSTRSSDGTVSQRSWWFLSTQIAWASSHHGSWVQAQASHKNKKEAKSSFMSYLRSPLYHFHTKPLRCQSSST